MIIVCICFSSSGSTTTNYFATNITVLDSLKNNANDIINTQPAVLSSSQTDIADSPIGVMDSLMIPASVFDSVIKSPTVISKPKIIIEKSTESIAIIKKPLYNEETVTTVYVDSILFAESPQTIIISGNEFFNESLLPTINSDPIKRKKENFNWPAIVLLILAALVGFARYLQPTAVRHTFKAAFNNRNFLQLIKEQNVLGEWFSYLLITVFLAAFSLLVFLSLDFSGYINTESVSQSTSVFLLVFALTTVFYVLKYLGLRFIAFVFKTDSATSFYFKNILLFNQIIGLIIFPFLLYNIFYQNTFVLIITWILFGLLSVFKILRGIAIGHNASNLSVYYLFLYLCAVEIAPILLILKTSANYFQGLH
ncbi:MAG: DUF4271 domain-containing protein [Bacteroidetes bacterium]|nr:DUF4271 domain-containing protein [Bacteroidota bacterium]